MAKNKSFNKHRWLISQLRRISLKYPPAFEVVNENKEVYYITSKKGKQLRRVKFVCMKCGKRDLKRTEVELDHIIPCVDSTGFADMGVFLERLFCDKSNYQLLCKECHLKKTQSEREVRLINKNSKKRKKILTNKSKYNKL